MDFLELMKKRGSTRRYNDREVDIDKVKDLFEIVRLAPSGGNAQPWMYTFVTEAEEKEKLKEKEAFQDDWVYDAPVITVCCTNPGVYKAATSKYDNPPEIKAVRDGAIGTFTFDLTLKNAGYSNCWVGWADEQVLKDVLHIPDFYKIPWVMTVGYSDREPKDRGRKSKEEIILDRSQFGQRDFTEYE